MSTPESKYEVIAKDGSRVLLSNQLEGISSCMDFMHKVLYTKELCYKAQTGSKVKRYRELSPLGEHLKHLHQYARLYSRSYTFHPALAFFFDEYRSHPLFGLNTNYRPDDVLGNGQVLSALFDDFVDSMRREAKDCGLKKKISDWESKIKKNKKRVNDLEVKLFKRYSRLYVVRLDLEYLKATISSEDVDKLIQNAADERAKDWERYMGGEDLPEPEPLRVLVPFEVVQSDRQRMFANMKGKPSLFKHLVGYVWRIECTPQAGYHLHVALFFHGSWVDDSSNLAQRIGEYWRDSITPGRGRFQNVNRAWNKDSPHYGLGTINHFDVTKRANLSEKVLKYLLLRLPIYEEKLGVFVPRTIREFSI